MTTSISLTINWDGKPVDNKILTKMNQCVHYHCPDGDLIWHGGNVAMTQANLVTLPEDDPTQIVGTENLKIVASCRLDNRDELSSILKPQCQLFNNTDTAIILAGYQVYGEKIVERLVGDFAFIIWDETQEKIIAAKDFCGLRRLFYYADQNKLIIASERTQLFQDPSLRLSPNLDNIIQYLTPSFQYYSGWDLGFFQGVKAIKAGHIFTAKKQQIKEQKFWQFSYLPQKNKSDSAWLEEYLFTLQQAVNCRLRSNQSIGIELSGGLDSSAIAALAGEMGKKISTLSMSFPNVPQVDETGRIKEILVQYPSLMPHFLNAESLFKPLFLRKNWQPQGLVTPYEMLAAPLTDLTNFAHQLGIKVLLTGLMGDALNYGSDRLFYDLFVGQKWQEFGARFNFAWQNSPQQALISLIFDGLFPFLPQSLFYSSLQFRAKKTAKGYFSRLPSYLNPQLKAQIIAVEQQIRLTKLSDIYSASAVRRTTLDYIYPPFVILTMTFPQAVERRHPYCDRRLIELVLSMPGELKWEARQIGMQGAGRFHHRQALKSKLPQSILSDRIGTEFTPALTSTVNKESIKQWLNQSSTFYLVEHGYVDGDLWQKNLEYSFQLDKYMVACLALESWFRLLKK